MILFQFWQKTRFSVLVRRGFFGFDEKMIFLVLAGKQYFLFWWENMISFFGGKCEFWVLSRKTWFFDICGKWDFFVLGKRDFSCLTGKRDFWFLKKNDIFMFWRKIRFSSFNGNMIFFFFGFGGKMKSFGCLEMRFSVLAKIYDFLFWEKNMIFQFWRKNEILVFVRKMWFYRFYDFSGKIFFRGFCEKCVFVVFSFFHE